MNKRQTLTLIASAVIEVFLVVFYGCGKSEASRETVELLRMKAFGKAFHQYTMDNNGVFPCAIWQLGSYIKNPETFAYYHDIESGVKTPWSIIVRDPKINGVALSLIGPKSFNARGKQRRLIMYSDDSVHVVENSECLLMVEGLKFFQLKESP